MGKTVTTLQSFVDVDPSAMALLMPQLSDEMLERSIARLEASITRPGANEALKFAREELDRRRATPASAAKPAAAPPMQASKAGPAIEREQVEHPAAENRAEEVAEEAQRLVFQARERGQALDIVDAVRMAREGLSAADAVAGSALDLVAQARDRGEHLDLVDAVQLAKLPRNHVDTVAEKAKQLQAEARERGEYLDAADAVARARRG